MKSKEYCILREVFLRNNKNVTQILQNSNFNALDINSKSNNYEWRKYLSDLGAKQVITSNSNNLEFSYCINCLSSGHISSFCEKRDKVYVIGDSHTALWFDAERFYINTDVKRIKLPGISAQGLINKESHLQSIKK